MAARAFTVLTPAKSFVAVAATPAAKAKWLELLDAGARRACTALVRLPRGRRGPPVGNCLKEKKTRAPAAKTHQHGRCTAAAAATHDAPFAPPLPPFPLF